MPDNIVSSFMLENAAPTVDGNNFFFDSNEAGRRLGTIALA